MVERTLRRIEKLRKTSTVTHSQQEKQVLSGQITNLVSFREYENDCSYCWSLRGRKKIKRMDANKYGEEKEKSKRGVVVVGNRNAMKAGISRRYRGG
jgi:hypothetical protein